MNSEGKSALKDILNSPSTLANDSKSTNFYSEKHKLVEKISEYEKLKTKKQVI